LLKYARRLYGNHFADHPDTFACRRAAVMAVQLRLGVLSEWRPGLVLLIIIVLLVAGRLRRCGEKSFYKVRESQALAVWEPVFTQ